MLYEYLKENYADGEPIFVSDIVIEGMSDVNLRQQFKVLTDSGRLSRYEKGIYYMPKKSRLKGSVGPGADMVAYYKYISRNSQVDGYYSGYTFANYLGLSTQVPMKIEIVSNNMVAKKRDIVIGNRTFVIRRPITKVTKENDKVLQLLDLLKNLDLYVDDDNDRAADLLEKYIRINQINRECVDSYISQYPDVTFRHFYEMRLDYVLA